MHNDINSCFVRLLIVNPRKHAVSVKENSWVNKISELQTLRGLHRLTDLSMSPARAEGLSAQKCVRARGRGRVGGASPARGRCAVPPRLSRG